MYQRRKYAVSAKFAMQDLRGRPTVVQRRSRKPRMVH